MVGKGRHPILGVWSPDPVLSAVAPVGLAGSAGTALIVDLTSPGRRSDRTLADLVAEGPALPELSPGRTGVAILPGGDVDQAAAVEMLEQLARHWPAIVVRIGHTESALATVPVLPLFPGRLTPVELPARGVWQPVAGGADPPGPGPVLPPLRSALIRRVLAGRLPVRSRWIDAWRTVWEMPWA